MITSDWDKLLLTTAEPDLASDRLVQLEKNGALRGVPPEGRTGLVRVLGHCHFLYHFLCRHPEEAVVCGQEPDLRQVTECADADAVRRYKYRELLKLCCADMAGTRDTAWMINGVSRLADSILTHLWKQQFAQRPQPCLLALGKLGANELNFSSDVDLMFVTGDPEDEPDVDAMTKEGDPRCADHIGAWTQRLEERTEEGFLYRVDLRLRPWGDAGPLLLNMEAMENYYAASAEAWERLVLLRARPVAGCLTHGEELLRRLNPFIYMRSLSSEDVHRFVVMKENLRRNRERSDAWDIKTGVGGIRDLEFASHILQILHGARHRDLRVTQTLRVMQALTDIGVIGEGESKEMISAYLYLRLVENRLQMKNEQQTHRLPVDPVERARLARSVHPDSKDPVADFEERVEWSRAVAAACFNRILPGQPEMEQE